MKRFLEKSNHEPFVLTGCLLPAFCVICSLLLPAHSASTWERHPSRCTVMCYMNGDNDLNNEVLHAVDMMETVGSSKNLNILALVDGSRTSQHGYGRIWERTRLLHITKDDHMGVINSPVLRELGERDLGDPQTLEGFVRDCLKFPAERYVFCTFAHGQGIIETNSLVLPTRQKSLAISPDKSSSRLMTHREFHDGLQKAMGNKKFDLMVFFSCLTNMVEVGYYLRDVTNYMVGSEDVIRIVNDPPGSFQIRGIRFEGLFREIRSNPDVPTIELGKKLVDSFIEQYQKDTIIPDADGKSISTRYSGGLSLVSCDNYGKLASRLDALARVLYQKMMCDEEEDVRPLLAEIHGAMAASQRYKSFLNLEYYDLQDFLLKLHELTSDQQVKTICRETLGFVRNQIVMYERHTADSRSNGVSIFLSNYLIPENVYEAHQAMYMASQFSQDTHWDEMIDLFRIRMGVSYPEMLIDHCQHALRNSDFLSFCETNPKIPWALQKSIMKGNWRPVMRYLDLLTTLHPRQLPIDALLSLREFLSASEKLDERALFAIERLNRLLKS